MSGLALVRKLVCREDGKVRLVVVRGEEIERRELEEDELWSQAKGWENCMRSGQRKKDLHHNLTLRASFPFSFLCSTRIFPPPSINRPQWLIYHYHNINDHLNSVIELHFFYLIE